MPKDTIKELVDRNIIPASGVVFDAFKKLYADALYCDYKTPSEYMNAMWNKYKPADKSNNANGKIFESLFSCLLYREKIYPLYVQAKVAFVPNINFDFLVYSKEFGPIALSLKVSLRERYKQADLEAISLKYVHRKAKCFLFTLDKKEAESVAKKIKNGDVLGIDEVCFVGGDDFNHRISELKKIELCEPKAIQIIEAQKVIKPR